MTDQDARTLRRCVAESIERNVSDCRDPLGKIDKVCLFDAVESDVESDSTLDYALGAYARRSLLEIMIGDYLRDASAEFVAQHREAEAILRNAKTLRKFVQVPRGGKVFELKRRMDLSMGEVQALIEYHKSKASAHAREYRWLLAVRKRAVQLGLTEGATVEQVLAA